MNQMSKTAFTGFRIFISCFLLVLASLLNALSATDIIPPLSQIKKDHPRVLLRPKTSPEAISLADLRALSKDADYQQLLKQLQTEKAASAQAMVWLLTGESAAADRALETLRAYRYPGEVDTFHVYFTLTQLALAYDWLYDYPAFTSEIKAEVRSHVMPLAERGLKYADDHMFHNYIWMSAGGVALWALATAGDDAGSDRVFERIRQRFNTGLFPAWKYLDGLPSEPMGYWSLYVFSPGMLTILASQSAFETNLVRAIGKSEGNWLNRNFENVVHSTLPDMRYIPWGDLQSGPNGGVTFDMAGIVDALTWATQSPQGAWFSQWLANKRGLRRFRGDTGMFYFLYTRHLKVSPAAPDLSFLAGNKQSAHFIARSGWDDGATIVTLRASDHFGDHHHYDQGSFIISRNALLAVDPPVYKKVRGPQQPTEVHNTLLFGSQGQRPARGQWFKTVEDFQKNLLAGRQLETGDMLFYKENGTWAGAACQFAQAYAPEQVQSCVRQLLFIRPGKVVIVDQLAAPANRSLPEVQWLLQMPKSPITDDSSFWTSNGKSWLRCRPLSPGKARRTVEATDVNTFRASLRYEGNASMRLVHLLEIGDGAEPPQPISANITEKENGLEVTVDTDKYLFSTKAPFGISKLEK